MKLTSKQLMFAQGKAEGLSNEKAMRGAGYAGSTLKQQATVLMKRKDIRAAIANAKNGTVVYNALDQFVAATAPNIQIMPKKNYTDSMVFLCDTMNNEKLSHASRARAAEQLMPYQHARIGEKGKKENKKDDAKAAGRGKFATQSPPPLRIVK